MGHGARQPRRRGGWSTPDAQWLEVDAARPQPRQDPRRAARAVLASSATQRDGRTPTARREMLEIPGAAFRKVGPRQGRHRQVPRRPARACRRKAATASSPRRASSCTGCRRRSAPCASSSSARCATRCRRSSRSSSTSTRSRRRDPRRPRASRRALRQGGRLRDQGASATGRPKMVLIGDIVGDDEDAVARAASRGRAHRERARRRGLRRRVGRDAQASSGSTARAPRRSPSTPTRSRSTRTSSSRSSGSATTPTASSASTSSCRSRTSSQLLDALDEYFAGRAAALPARREAAGGGAARRPAGAGARARRAHARALAVPARQPRSRRRARRAATSCRRSRCRRRRERAQTTLFALLQNHTLRVSWKEEVRARARAASSTASVPRRSSKAFDAVHAPRAARPRVRRAAHARRRRQRAHQHPGQLRRLRDAAGRRTPRSRASCGSRAALGGVISGEHGIGITKLEFLDRTRSRRSAPTSSEVDPEGRFNTRQAPARRRPARRLHAVASR